MNDANVDTPLSLAEADLLWREVDDQIIVLDRRTWSYLSINDSGAGLWKAIAAGATKHELAEHLCRTYGLDEQTATRDVEAFVSTMQSHDFLRDLDGPK